MAKYRLLTRDELEGLEKEFVEYLILNGIAADDWVKIKKEDPGGAERIVHLFSDVVFEKIMRKTHFLEWGSPKEIKVLYCQKKKFVLVGLNATKIPEANLEDADYLKKAMQNPPENLEIYTKDIPYEISREEEMFKMTEIGYHMSDDKLFKTLCLVLPQ